MSMSMAITDDILSELRRLHERLDNYERIFSALAQAFENNPMLKAMIPGGIKVN